MSSNTKRYNAMVLGDGRILPIVESLGKKQLREIDPISSEGRKLLQAGRVRLCYDDGRRVEAIPILDALEHLDHSTRLRRNESGVSAWSTHHDRILESIDRMKKKLGAGN